MNVLRDGERGSQQWRQNELRMHPGTDLNERQIQMRITEEEGEQRIANAYALRTVMVEMQIEDSTVSLHDGHQTDI